MKLDEILIDIVDNIKPYYAIQINRDVDEYVVTYSHDDGAQIWKSDHYFRDKNLSVALDKMRTHLKEINQIDEVPF